RPEDQLCRRRRRLRVRRQWRSDGQPVRHLPVQGRQTHRAEADRRQEVVSEAPSPALRERVASEASRVRVSPATDGSVRTDPQPPSPAGWAPPSPAVQERGLLSRLPPALWLVVMLVALAVLFSVLRGPVAVGQATLNGLVGAGYFALGAVGLTLVFGILRLVNFAHGDFLTTGAYVTLGAAAAGLPFCPAAAPHSPALPL